MAGTTDDTRDLAAILDAILREHGTDILEERSRLAELLRQRAPHDPRAVHLLMTAYDAGVPGRLKEAGAPVSDFKIGQETAQIVDHFGSSPEPARAAVETWAKVLAGAADLPVRPALPPPSLEPDAWPAPAIAAGEAAVLAASGPAPEISPDAGPGAAEPGTAEAGPAPEPVEPRPVSEVAGSASPLELVEPEPAADLAGDRAAASSPVPEPAHGAGREREPGSRMANTGPLDPSPPPLPQAAASAVQPLPPPAPEGAAATRPPPPPPPPLPPGGAPKPRPLPLPGQAFGPAPAVEAVPPRPRPLPLPQGGAPVSAVPLPVPGVASPVRPLPPGPAGIRPLPLPGAPAASQASSSPTWAILVPVVLAVGAGGLWASGVYDRPAPKEAPKRSDPPRTEPPRTEPPLTDPAPDPGPKTGPAPRAGATTDEGYPVAEVDQLLPFKAQQIDGAPNSLLFAFGLRSGSQTFTYQAAVGFEGTSQTGIGLIKAVKQGKEASTGELAVTRVTQGNGYVGFTLSGKLKGEAIGAPSICVSALAGKRPDRFDIAVGEAGFCAFATNAAGLCDGDRKLGCGDLVP